MARKTAPEKRPESIELPPCRAQELRCAECAYVTLSKSKLALHTQAQHLKIKMYSCDECGFATAYGSLLKEHAVKQHRPHEMLCCR